MLTYQIYLVVATLICCDSTRTMNLNDIWRAGRDCAVEGGNASECPYNDTVQKHAWMLGYTAGLQVLKGTLPR